VRASWTIRFRGPQVYNTIRFWRKDAALLDDRKACSLMKQVGQRAPADVGLLQHILSNHGVDIMVGKRSATTRTRADARTPRNPLSTPLRPSSRFRNAREVFGYRLARMGEAKV
jgi:hypothetical protein